MKINYCNYARLNNHRFTQNLHMLFERFKITRWYMVLTRSHRFSCLKLRSNSLFWWKTATCKFLAFSPSSYFYLSSPDQIPHTFCKMMTSVSDLQNLRSFETLYIAHIFSFLAVFERHFSKLLLSVIMVVARAFNTNPCVTGWINWFLFIHCASVTLSKL